MGEVALCLNFQLWEADLFTFSWNCWSDRWERDINGSSFEYECGNISMEYQGTGPWEEVLFIRSWNYFCHYKSWWWVPVYFSMLIGKESILLSLRLKESVSSRLSVIHRGSWKVSRWTPVSIWLIPERTSRHVLKRLENNILFNETIRRIRCTIVQCHYRPTRKYIPCKYDQQHHWQ